MKLPEDRYVDVEGLRTRYWSVGETGSPVLCIHGLGAYCESWLPTVHGLAANHRVYALDLPGFGRTAKPRGYGNIDAFARFTDAFMAKVGIDRAAVFGNSMGGAVAMTLARKYAARVERLVLVSAFGFGGGGTLAIQLRAIALPFLGEVLARPDRKQTRRFLRWLVYDKSWASDDRVELGYRMRCEPGAVKSLCETTRSMVTVFGVREETLRPLREGVRQIAQPTLIVWGVQDPLLSVLGAREAVRDFPRARLHEFDRCGHMAQLEVPVEFNALALKFLGEGASVAA